MDQEYKLRACLRAVLDASAQSKPVGDFIRGGFVRNDNHKTTAQGECVLAHYGITVSVGVLRRQSVVRLSSIASVSSAFSIGQACDNKQEVADLAAANQGKAAKFTKPPTPQKTPATVQPSTYGKTPQLGLAKESPGRHSDTMLCRSPVHQWK